MGAKPDPSNKMIKRTAKVSYTQYILDDIHLPMQQCPLLVFMYMFTSVSVVCVQKYTNFSIASTKFASSE